VRLRWPSDIETIMAGMAALGVSLVARHAEPTDAMVVLAWATGWIGSILVIVGVGRVIFLTCV
jgi:hypothetical protein